MAQIHITALDIRFLESFILNPPQGGQLSLPTGDYSLVHSGGPHPGDFGLNPFGDRRPNSPNKLASVGVKLSIELS